MKPIEINPAIPVRNVGTDAARAKPDAHARSSSSVANPAEPSMVARSGVLWSGEKAPVDLDRVAEIRTALREGRYPLLPAKLADHMIAASYVLIDGRESQ